MRSTVGNWMFAVAIGLGAVAPSMADALPSYRLAEKCAKASGFTARAIIHPDYKVRKVHATPQELAFMNRCIDATLAARTAKAPKTQAIRKTRTTRSVRGTLPVPHQYPLMSGDEVLWPRMTLHQQRRAMQFLKSGSTILSSLQGD